MGPEVGSSELNTGLRAAILKLAVVVPPSAVRVTIVTPKRASLLMVKVALTELAVLRTPLMEIPGLSVLREAPVRFVPVKLNATAEPKVADAGVMEAIVGG
jgi:hypothetical protein